MIAKATATVTITPASLTQIYTGSALAVATTTMPASLAVVCTYAGVDGTTYVSSTTAPAAVGIYSVSCVVNDANFAGFATGTLTILNFTVTSISGGNSGNTVIATPGGTASNTIDVTPSSGTTLPTDILLTITGLPAGATATVTPSTWTQQSSTTWMLPALSTLTQLTVIFQLPSTTASLTRERDPRSKLPPILWGLLLLPFAGYTRRFGRKLNRSGRTLLLIGGILAGLAGASGLSGCGSSSGFFGQAQQSYTITETITAGANSQSTSFTLTIE